MLRLKPCNGSQLEWRPPIQHDWSVWSLMGPLSKAAESTGFHLRDLLSEATRRPPTSSALGTVQWDTWLLRAWLRPGGRSSTPQPYPLDLSAPLNRPQSFFCRLQCRSPLLLPAQHHPMQQPQPWHSKSLQPMLLHRCLVFIRGSVLHSLPVASDTPSVQLLCCVADIACDMQPAASSSPPFADSSGSFADAELRLLAVNAMSPPRNTNFH